MKEPALRSARGPAELHEERAMIDFFKDGGWGMWAILFVGVLLLVSSGRFAHKPEPRRLGLICILALSTLFSMLHTTLLDLGTVFGAVAHEGIPEQQLLRMFLQGMKECTRPGVFGAMILTVASLLVAVGMSRRARSDEA